MADINVTQTSNTRRATDASFDLNLAPFLDIVVSIIPMLLLSAVFIEIKTIDTPIPTPVAEAIANDAKNNELVITLKVSNQKGFEYVISDKGRKTSTLIYLKNKAFDYIELTRVTRQLKDRYPDKFNLQLAPEKDVSFNEIVKTMDKVRKQGQEDRKIAFVDPKSGQRVETDLMFPNVTFSNVVGE